MRLKLERLKSKAGLTWLNSSDRLGRPVRIISSGMYWRKNRAGYTECKCNAGVYSMADAWNAARHCGPEKRVHFEFLKDRNAVLTQECRVNRI